MGWWWQDTTRRVFDIPALCARPAARPARVRLAAYSVWRTRPWWAWWQPAAPRLRARYVILWPPPHPPGRLPLVVYLGPQHSYAAGVRAALQRWAQTATDGAGGKPPDAA
jgi:hypothetical protein